MKARTKLVAAGAVAIGAAVATAGVVAASGGGDTDTPIPSPALERASQAALDHMGGGRVTGTEVGDEDSYYEVEVTLHDGSQVDVQLDQDFAVVDTMADHEPAADADD